MWVNQEQAFDSSAARFGLQVDADLDQINFRFDVVKKQELRQRQMIEQSVVRLRNWKRLRQVFTCLKTKWEETKAYERKESTASKRYWKRQKGRLFHFWRQVTEADCPKVRKLERQADSELEALKTGYMTRINLLKSRILEVEQKIELVDHSTQFFVNGIAASYQQAIGMLTSELSSIQRAEPGGVTRPREQGRDIDAGRAVAEAGVPEGTGRWEGGTGNDQGELAVDQRNQLGWVRQP